MLNKSQQIGSMANDWMQYFRLTILLSEGTCHRGKSFPVSPTISRFIEPKDKKHSKKNPMTMEYKLFQHQASSHLGDYCRRWPSDSEKRLKRIA